MSTVTLQTQTQQDLWRVVETADTKDAEFILLDGVDVNAANGFGTTALMRAAAHGQVAMVRVLLSHGADPNLARNDQFTPLLLAAFFGHLDVIDVLIKHGANPDAVTRFGTTARMWAASRIFVDLVDYLDQLHAESHNEIQEEPEMPSSNNEVEIPTAVITDYSSKPEESFSSDPVHEDSDQSPLEVPGPSSVPESTLISQPLKPRMALYSAATILLTLAVVAGMSLRSISRLGEVRPERQSAPVEKPATVSIEKGQLNITTPLPAQITNTTDEVKTVTGTRSIEPNNARSTPRVVTPNLLSAHRIRSSSQTQVQKVDKPTTATQDVKLTPAPAPSPKPQPAVSPGVTPKSRPAPLTPQLISPSKNSPGKGRTIQWP